MSGFGPGGGGTLAARLAGDALPVVVFICGMCFSATGRLPCKDVLLPTDVFRVALFVCGTGLFIAGGSTGAEGVIAARHAAEMMLLRASRQRNTRS